MRVKLQINQQFNDLKAEIENLEGLFSGSAESIHKARNELRIVTLKGQRYILKAFKVPGFPANAIYGVLRDSKAYKSYHNSILLKDYAPRPVAYMEKKQGCLLQQSFYLSEAFDYDFTIREPLLDADFPDRDFILRGFARFSLKLHNDGFFHRDYSPGNILIRREGDGFIFKVVDVNRLSISALSDSDRARSFSKLWARPEDLTIIAEEYGQHTKVGKRFAEDVVRFSEQNKSVKNFKKRLKGKPVTD